MAFTKETLDFRGKTEAEIINILDEYNIPLTPEEIKKIQDDTKDIKSYLNEIMQVLGETNISTSKDLATRKAELDKRYSKRFKDVEKIVFPLLYNLMKSDEPYIHWPNRKPIIRGQIEKILKITREK